MMERRVGWLLVAAPALAGLAIAGHTFVGWAGQTAVVICLISIVVGELFSAHSGGQQLAPISVSGLAALALAPMFANGQLITVPLALGVGAVGLLVGQGIRAALGWGADLLSAWARVIFLAMVLLLGRGPWLDGMSVATFASERPAGAMPAALALLVVSTVACAAESQTFWTIRRRSLRAPLQALWSGQLGHMWSLLTGLPFVLTFVALGAPALGVWSLLIFQWPIWLALAGIRRYSKVRQTVRESVDTLSRMTEVTGHTRPGHARLVADVCLLVGRELGLHRSQLSILERAALLHDLGQVVLRTALPGGATVEAAPADQHLIAGSGLRIVQQTGGFDDLSPILAHQCDPYRLVREQGEDIPLESRILKAVNAYVDLTEGALSARAHHAALERISLGLGYEYDPAVVDALGRVTDPTAAAV